MQQHQQQALLQQKQLQQDKNRVDDVISAEKRRPRTNTEQQKVFQDSGMRSNSRESNKGQQQLPFNSYYKQHQQKAQTPGAGNRRMKNKVKNSETNPDSRYIAVLSQEQMQQQLISSGSLERKQIMTAKSVGKSITATAQQKRRQQIYSLLKEVESLQLQMKKVPESKGKHYLSRYTRIGEASNLNMHPQPSQFKAQQQPLEEMSQIQKHAQLVLQQFEETEEKQGANAKCSCITTPKDDNQNVQTTMPSVLQNSTEYLTEAQLKQNKRQKKLGHYQDSNPYFNRPQSPSLNWYSCQECGHRVCDDEVKVAGGTEYTQQIVSSENQDSLQEEASASHTILAGNGINLLNIKSSGSQSKQNSANLSCSNCGSQKMLATLPTKIKMATDRYPEQHIVLETMQLKPQTSLTQTQGEFYGRQFSADQISLSQETQTKVAAADQRINTGIESVLEESEENKTVLINPHGYLLNLESDRILPKKRTVRKKSSGQQRQQKSRDNRSRSNRSNKTRVKSGGQSIRIGTSGNIMCGKCATHHVPADIPKTYRKLQITNQNYGLTSQKKAGELLVEAQQDLEDDGDKIYLEDDLKIDDDCPIHGLLEGSETTQIVVDDKKHPIEQLAEIQPSDMALTERAQLLGEGRKIRDSMDFTSQTMTARMNVNLDELNLEQQEQLSDALITELRAIANGKFQLKAELPVIVSTRQSVDSNQDKPKHHRINLPSLGNQSVKERETDFEIDNLKSVSNIATNAHKSRVTTQELSSEKKEVLQESEIQNKKIDSHNSSHLPQEVVISENEVDYEEQEEEVMSSGAASHSQATSYSDFYIMDEAEEARLKQIAYEKFILEQARNMDKDQSENETQNFTDLAKETSNKTEGKSNDLQSHETTSQKQKRLFVDRSVQYSIRASSDVPAEQIAQPKLQQQQNQQILENINSQSKQGIKTSHQTLIEDSMDYNDYQHLVQVQESSGKHQKTQSDYRDNLSNQTGDTKVTVKAFRPQVLDEEAKLVREDVSDYMASKQLVDSDRRLDEERKKLRTLNDLDDLKLSSKIVKLERETPNTAIGIQIKEDENNQRRVGLQSQNYNSGSAVGLNQDYEAIPTVAAISQLKISRNDEIDSQQQKPAQTHNEDSRGDEPKMIPDDIKNIFATYDQKKLISNEQQKVTASLLLNQNDPLDDIKLDGRTESNFLSDADRNDEEDSPSKIVVLQEPNVDKQIHYQGSQDVNRAIMVDQSQQDSRIDQQELLQRNNLVNNFEQDDLLANDHPYGMNYTISKNINHATEQQYYISGGADDSEPYVPGAPEKQKIQPQQELMPQPPVKKDILVGGDESEPIAILQTEYSNPVVEVGDEAEPRATQLTEQSNPVISALSCSSHPSRNTLPPSQNTLPPSRNTLPPSRNSQQPSRQYQSSMYTTGDDNEPAIPQMETDDDYTQEYLSEQQEEQDVLQHELSITNLPQMIVDEYQTDEQAEEIVGDDFEPNRPDSQSVINDVVPTSAEPKSTSVEPMPASAETKSASQEPIPSSTQTKPAQVEPKPSSADSQPISADYMPGQYDYVPSYYDKNSVQESSEPDLTQVNEELSSAKPDSNINAEVSGPESDQPYADSGIKSLKSPAIRSEDYSEQQTSNDEQQHLVQPQILVEVVEEPSNLETPTTQKRSTELIQFQNSLLSRNPSEPPNAIIPNSYIDQQAKILKSTVNAVEATRQLQDSKSESLMLEHYIEDGGSIQIQAGSNETSIQSAGLKQQKQEETVPSQEQKSISYSDKSSTESKRYQLSTADLLPKTKIKKDQGKLVSKYLINDKVDNSGDIKLPPLNLAKTTENDQNTSKNETQEDSNNGVTTIRKRMKMQTYQKKTKLVKRRIRIEENIQHTTSAAKEDTLYSHRVEDHQNNNEQFSSFQDLDTANNQLTTEISVEQLNATRQSIYEQSPKEQNQNKKNSGNQESGALNPMILAQGSTPKFKKMSVANLFASNEDRHKRMQSNRDEKRDAPQTKQSILPDFKNLNQHLEFNDELQPAAIIDQYYTQKTTARRLGRKNASISTKEKTPRDKSSIQKNRKSAVNGLSNAKTTSTGLDSVEVLLAQSTKQLKKKQKLPTPTTLLNSETKNSVTSLTADPSNTNLKTSLKTMRKNKKMLTDRSSYLTKKDTADTAGITSNFSAHYNKFKTKGATPQQQTDSGKVLEKSTDRRNIKVRSKLRKNLLTADLYFHGKVTSDDEDENTAAHSQSIMFNQSNAYIDSSQRKKMISTSMMHHKDGTSLNDDIETGLLNNSATKIYTQQSIEQPPTFNSSGFTDNYGLTSSSRKLQPASSSSTRVLNQLKNSSFQTLEKIRANKNSTILGSYGGSLGPQKKHNQHSNSNHQRLQFYPQIVNNKKKQSLPRTLGGNDRSLSSIKLLNSNPSLNKTGNSIGNNLEFRLIHDNQHAPYLGIKHFKATAYL